MKTKLFSPDNYGFQPCNYNQADAMQRAEAAGGCGPGGAGDKFVPDTMYGLSVKRSCAIHDWCYHYGTTPEEKERSDDIFLNNMVRQIEAESKSKILKRLRLRRAKTYYYSVSWFGGSAFYNNTNEESEMA